MANNRLYIGNKFSKEFIFVEKGYGSGWTTGYFDGELIQLFIAENTYGESNFQPTNLVFFTEQDNELFDFFFEHGKQIKIEDLKTQV